MTFVPHVLDDFFGLIKGFGSFLEVEENPILKRDGREGDIHLRLPGLPEGYVQSTVSNLK